MAYTYWYAIIQAPADLTAPAAWGRGLGDSALRLAVAGGLAAVVSDWPQATVNRSSDAVDAALVWEHEHVIERVMAGCTVLPMRFGSLLADDERVQALLLERQATLQADLVHVDGCVELGLRVLWDPPVPDAVDPPVTVPVSVPTPGVLYLLRRAAEEQRRQAVRAAGATLAQELSHRLRTRSVDMRQSVLQTERMLLTASFLVPQDEVAAFLAAVEELRQEYSHLAFMCSGPWPPYHFMSA